MRPYYFNGSRQSFDGVLQTVCFNTAQANQCIPFSEPDAGFESYASQVTQDTRKIFPRGLNSHAKELLIDAAVIGLDHPEQCGFVSVAALQQLDGAENIGKTARLGSAFSSVSTSLNPLASLMLFAAVQGGEPETPALAGVGINTDPLKEGAKKMFGPKPKPGGVGATEGDLGYFAYRVMNELGRFTFRHARYTFLEPFGAQRINLATAIRNPQHPEFRGRLGALYRHDTKVGRAHSRAFALPKEFRHNNLTSQDAARIDASGSRLMKMSNRLNILDYRTRGVGNLFNLAHNYHTHNGEVTALDVMKNGVYVTDTAGVAMSLKAAKYWSQGHDLKEAANLFEAAKKADQALDGARGAHVPLDRSQQLFQGANLIQGAVGMIRLAIALSNDKVSVIEASQAAGQSAQGAGWYGYTRYARGVADKEMALSRTATEVAEKLKHANAANSALSGAVKMTARVRIGLGFITMVPDAIAFGFAYDAYTGIDGNPNISPADKAKLKRAGKITMTSIGLSFLSGAFIVWKATNPIGWVMLGASFGVGIYGWASEHI